VLKPGEATLNDESEAGGRAWFGSSSSQPDPRGTDEGGHTFLGLNEERTKRENCPLCQSGKRSVLRRVERRGQAYEIARCARCGFGYVTDPRRDTADHVEEAAIGWEFRPRHHQTRRLLLQHLASGARIAEIGCGRGELGFLMRSDPVDYVGYEPARGLSDFGLKRGVNILQTAFTPEPQSAEAVILDNVLEHVLDPKRMIHEAILTLRPGGLLVIIVPNRWDIRQLVPAWRDRHLWIPPDHINYFRWSDLSGLLRQCGLTPRPFAFSSLQWRNDMKFVPRALLERFGLHILGHNMYSIKPV
jgi:SAM-dependent methyltransferase